MIERQAFGIGKLSRSRVIPVLTAIIGLYQILIHDFELRSTISTWFSKPGWEWEMACCPDNRRLINLIVTVVRLRSRRLREAALKNLEHSHAILILIGAQALQALLPLMFAFLVIPMLGLPNHVVRLFERFTTQAGAIMGSFNDGFTINHGFLRASDGTVGAEEEERAFEVAHEELLLIFDVRAQRSSASAESARLIRL